MIMIHTIRILPGEQHITVQTGSNLLETLRSEHLMTDAPCGGYGTCGKCRVIVNGKQQLACQYTVNCDIDVFIPKSGKKDIDTKRTEVQICCDHNRLAFDVGTTTVVCYLLDEETGQELAYSSMLNPQTSYGADVISRAQAAAKGNLDQLTQEICHAMSQLIYEVCDLVNADLEYIRTVAVVGNPAMQQLFLGIPTDNLITVPFTPVLKQAEIIPAVPYLPLCENAKLLVVPDISGYVGADTIAAVLATGIHRASQPTLLVDIGTNGEMVLTDGRQMVCCSTAAGPALEGAKIRHGMRGTAGAIDHVWNENGVLNCSVIGEETAVGICGSGIIDAVAAALDLGHLNSRGRIQTKDEADGQRYIPLRDGVYLTQQDIREVQLTKGAIAAGIACLAAELGIALDQIGEVILAGAFGSFLNPESACRIGLLPPVLQGKIRSVGNAAGEGAKLLAMEPSLLLEAQYLAENIRFIELANIPGFQRTFAKNMLLIGRDHYGITEN